MGDIEDLILLFEVPAMLQLKPWSARGVSHRPAYIGKYQRRSSSAKICRALLDDWANGGCVDGLLHLLFGELVLFKEWISNLGAPLCGIAQGKWNVGKVAFQEFNIRYQSKISYFCFWCESREWGGGLSSRFSCVAPGMERYSLDLPWVFKNRGYALEVGFVGVLGLWMHGICNHWLI